ncbi:MAG: helix-turn-helix domain-containing protein [Clostridia bacterium]|nr:helix-turn-helix domain-containing protein [Clostridia bacterium]
MKNTTLTQKEIAKKYNVSRTTVTAINNGQNHK